MRRVAWLIALIAVYRRRFMPVAMLGAGLSFTNAVVFAVGCCRERSRGLLPVITLALAVGVRELVRGGRGQAAERNRNARLHQRHLH